MADTCPRVENDRLMKKKRIVGEAVRAERERIDARSRFVYVSSRGGSRFGFDIDAQ